MQNNLVTLAVTTHPLLDLGAFVTEFPITLGEMSAESIAAVLARQAIDPSLVASDAIRAAVRDLLRHGGFKPTGRSKPASEYLLKAVSEVPLPTINAAVDACNHVSLHSGLPISVVDLARTEAPLHVAIAPTGASYLFNLSGQSIDLAGLLCLFDAAGPCANAVKDAQRTKTDASTRRTLSLVWGTTALPGRTAGVTQWYERVITALGGLTHSVLQNSAS